MTYAENERVVRDRLDNLWERRAGMKPPPSVRHAYHALDAMSTEHRGALNRERTERGLALAAEAEAASFREQLQDTRGGKAVWMPICYACGNGPLTGGDIALGLCQECQSALATPTPEREGPDG